MTATKVFDNFTRIALAGSFTVCNFSVRANTTVIPELKMTAAERDTYGLTQAVIDSNRLSTAQVVYLIKAAQKLLTN